MNTTYTKSICTSALIKSINSSLINFASSSSYYYQYGLYGSEDLKVFLSVW